MRSLQEPDIAWQELRNIPSLDSLHSESYLNIALDHWLLAKYPLSPEFSRSLRKLGVALKKNQGDSWLSDFIASPSSEKANQLLQAAIIQNGKGGRIKAQRLRKRHVIYLSINVTQPASP